MQDEGYVAKLLYEEGTKDIPLGKLLAILVDDEGDIGAFNDFKDDAQPEQAASSAQPVQSATPAAAAIP